MTNVVVRWSNKQMVMKNEELTSAIMATKMIKLSTYEKKTEKIENQCCYQSENSNQKYQCKNVNQVFINQCDNQLLVNYSSDCTISCKCKCRNNLYVFLYGILMSIFAISLKILQRKFYMNSLRSRLRSRSRCLSIMPTKSLPIIALVFLQLNCLLSCSRFGLVTANKIDVLANELEYESETKPSGHFTHTWAVHIPNGDSGLADSVAADHGFMNMGKIFEDHYHFVHHKVSKRSVSPSKYHQRRLSDDNRVHWSVQQVAKSRRKRDFIRMRPSRTSSKAMSLVDSIQLNDPKWSQMWYLNRGGGLDMNVIPAWKEGITGKGVVVTILDDGLESDHPDIEHNYDPKASYDVNSHDDDPMPHYDMTDSNRHGTRCAGEVAATANNSICAVGIAFGASVGGVRMLDGDVTDAVEARSLSLNPSHIDIYSASWGPDDDGKTVDGPNELASRAFIEGVNKGRNGKGSIFIWASGNGGRELDNCNCDGYTNSIWTLSISSATEEGHVPWYSEKCSSTLATTYSSGGQGEKQVVTTDLHHSCTVSHTGTSASAPLAAGIAALALEANGNLTWRDLQHIVVRTAKPANLKDTTWSKNGVGRRVSHSFGYGLMDAAEMVRVARAWKTVPEQQRCEINAPHVDKVIPPRSYITLQLVVKHCTSVNFLEHVQAKITLTSQRRGDIQLFLTSPSGTKVTLLTSRTHDVSRSGFKNWPFMSVHTWGEAPHGDWQLEIHNEGRFIGHAMLREWSLIFYGTTYPIDPNDPISARPTPSPNSTYTASPSSTNLHQIYSPQYPRLPPSSQNSYLPNLLLNKSNSKLNSLLLGNISGNGNARKQQQQQHQLLLQQHQQQYHQISATYGVILGSPKSKAKNSKNNSSNGKAGSKNLNGSGSNNSKSSNRPNLPTSLSVSKNNYYRIPITTNNNNSKISSSSTTARISATTQRPKNGQQSVYNANIDIGRGKLLKGKDKIPIKAPKQVKENNAAYNPASLSSLIAGDILESSISASSDSDEKNSQTNHRIPKLFQQYEKIQQIFPEFQPYSVQKNAKLTSTSSEIVIPPSSSLSSSSISTSMNRQGPNRKQFQFYDSSTVIGGVGGRGGSSKSISGISINNNGGIIRNNITRNSSTNPKPSRENSKKSFQQQTSTVINTEIERQLQHQKNNNYKSNERIYIPNRKSTNAQITQWDLIFYGTEKPAQPDDPVRISPGQVNSYGSDMEHNGLEYDSDTASGQWRDTHQVGESRADIQGMSNMQASDACQKYSYDQRCIECATTTILFKNHCFTRCPNQFYEIPTDVPKLHQHDDSVYSNELHEIKKRQSTGNQRRCESCNKSCLQCFGPNSYQCTSCFPGSQLRIISANESYCYVFAERSSGNSKSIEDSKQSDRKNVFVFLIILLPMVALLILIVYIVVFGKGLSWTHFKSKNYVYERVALKMSSDEIQFLTDGTNEDEI